MGASIIPAATITTPSDNWVQIAATNPAATSLNFTGISGYKKLMFFWSGTGQSATTIRFNSDSGSKYQYTGTSLSTSTPYVVTSFSPLTTNLSTGGTIDTAKMFINSADNAGLKTTEYYMVSSSVASYGTGLYQASAAITSINFTWGSTFSTTVYLYGVLA